MPDEILTICNIALTREYCQYCEANLPMPMISSRFMIPMTAIRIQAPRMGLCGDGNKSRTKDQQQMYLGHAHSYSYILIEINHLLRVIPQYDEILQNIISYK